MDNADVIVKMPTQVKDGKAAGNSLLFDGYSIMELCSNSFVDKGTLFQDVYTLFFVLNGVFKLTHGKRISHLHEKEMILVKKGISMEFE